MACLGRVTQVNTGGAHVVAHNAINLKVQMASHVSTPH